MRAVRWRVGRLSGIVFLRLATCVLAITLFSGSVLAQAPRDPFDGITGISRSNGTTSPKNPLPDEIPPGIEVSPISADVYQLTTLEACNSWTEFGVHSPAVSVARLRIPGKAASEYQKACGALKDKRLPTAEEHARKAIQMYPDYAAAWVVLGQILKAERKTEDARGACLQAQRVDAGYVAPYLCLAEFAAQAKDWQEVGRLAGRALDLDPVDNFYALYYSASAAFYGDRSAEAEAKALDAIKLDKWNRLPQLHMLLARIYAGNGDARGEAVQLRRYLKLSPSAEDSAEARQTLAKLEAAPPK